MIRLFVALCITVLATLAKGQENDLRVFSTAGASFHNDDIMLDWTMGEVLITLLENDSMMISQGFHQPDYRLVSSRPIIVNPTNIKVFPNPFSDQLTIQSALLSGKNGVVHLADITGKVFWQKQIDGASIQEYSFSQSLSPGYYILSIQLFGDPGLYTIPVINMK